LLERTPAKKSRRFVDRYTMIFNNGSCRGRAMRDPGLMLVVGNYLNWLR
jgi:hypothetical protein